MEKFEVGKKYKSRVNPIKGLEYEILEKMKTVCKVVLWEDGKRTSTEYKGVKYSHLIS